MNVGRSESRGATSSRARRKAPARHPQRRDHRARRPRQDDACRRPAQAIARLRRPRTGRRVDHGFERSRAGEGNHDPRQDHFGSLQRGQAQHHRHPGPRGLRGRGRASPRDGGRLPVAGRRRRGPDAADAGRASPGARSRPAADHRGQQDRPHQRPAGRDGRGHARPAARACQGVVAAGRAGPLHRRARGHRDRRPHARGRHARAPPRRHPRARAAAPRGPRRPPADAGEQPRPRQLERPARARADSARHRASRTERRLLHGVGCGADRTDRDGAHRRGAPAPVGGVARPPARSSTSLDSRRLPSATPSPTPNIPRLCRASRSASRRCGCSSRSTSHRSPGARQP